MISVENLTKSYGGRTLFESINFRVNSGERIGLVGRNGYGKTTLFRLIKGEAHADSGAVIIPKNYRIGYVRQTLEFTKNTILEEGMTGLSEGEKEHHWKVEKILAGLGFTMQDMSRRPEEFSGGYQVRLNLAKILASDPDMLLLDEPTNYLDITSIRWIIRFLNNWPHELILITHDRSFMDKLATHIIGIHRRKMRKIAGNTENFYSQIAQDEEVHEKTRLNDEKRQKEIKQFITRFRAKARLANMVQSRIKTLEKMEKKEKLEKLKTLDFYFRSKPFSGKHVMSARDISFSYDDQPLLFKHLDITVGAKNRFCIIGKNGKGKTTLLKLLGGTLRPQTGEIVYNPNVTIGFFEQTNIKTLVDTHTVEEEILYSADDIDQQQARNICGAMMFEGEDAQKKIKVLSGGEKSRVMLGKILASRVNLLLLDEPTNHLDMEACDSLLAALDNFEGTIIMVTHNEMFLHALAQKLILFQNDRAYVFEGSYQDFLDRGGWEDEKPQGKRVSVMPDPNSSTRKLIKKELKRRKSEIITERGKILNPIKENIARTENEIEEFEIELARYHQEMIKVSQEMDGKKIEKLSREIYNCQSTIDALYNELEELTTVHDEQHKIFEKKLKKIQSR